MLPAFKLLAKFKFLRGTAFDPFGYTAERKVERALIGEYEVLVGELLATLTATNHDLAVHLASVPDDIKGMRTRLSYILHNRFGNPYYIQIHDTVLALYQDIDALLKA